MVGEEVATVLVALADIWSQRQRKIDVASAWDVLILHFAREGL